MEFKRFNRAEVLDFKSSLSKDLVRCNNLGACTASSVILCNTKSWHGLLSVPDEKTGQLKLLLSNLDDVVVSNGRNFPLSTRKYPNVYHPLGHQFINDISTNPWPKIEYSIGNILLEKEIILCQAENTVLVKYSLINAEQPITLQITPLLAFRPALSLIRLDKSYYTSNRQTKNGICYKPNDNTPPIYLQTSVKCEFITAPDWNYNIEYLMDQAAGQPYQEDLFMPGFFETTLEKGQDIIFCASVKRAQQPALLDVVFNRETSQRSTCKTYEDCILQASKNFFSERRSNMVMVSNIPEYTISASDTFRALPGLTLPYGNFKLFKSTTQYYLKNFNADLERGALRLDNDSPFWFIWAIQQLYFQTGDPKDVYTQYGKYIKSIIRACSESYLGAISMAPNGLVGVETGFGRAYYVETNALWYNALMFAASLFSMHKDRDTADYAASIANSMVAAFGNAFDHGFGYLVDSVSPNGLDTAFKPGQILAFALPYSCGNDAMASNVLDMIDSKLLTPKGLRMLPPDDADYNKLTGAVMPRYSGFLAELYIKVLGDDGVKKAEKLYHAFEPDMGGMASPAISKYYDCTPPYHQFGPLLDAPAVGEIARIKILIDQY